MDKKSKGSGVASALGAIRVDLFRREGNVEAKWAQSSVLNPCYNCSFESTAVIKRRKPYPASFSLRNNLQRAIRAGRCPAPGLMISLAGPVQRAKMSTTVLLQSFRAHDVPAWVSRCRESVRRYASEQNWTYRFAGDEFFDWAPAWVREGGAENIWGLSDICRLEWIKDALKQWDMVVWADIDILVINSSRIPISPANSYGFAYELACTEGGLRHGINNAFMFFRKNSDMLTTYLEKCYEILREKNGPDGCERTAIGPDLLMALNVPESHVIKGLNILNALNLLGMYKTPSRQIPESMRALTKSPIGAVNLCLNERSCFEGNERLIYDHVLDTVTAALLAKPSDAADPPLCRSVNSDNT